ncbi:unnamed protein product [Parajaminaea phylloscopi]
MSGIYNTSYTPAHLPWDTYNYCNAPHLSHAHYTPPREHNVRLVYVTAFQRHAKRTPDNLVPRDEKSFNPPGGWDCSDLDVWTYASTEPPHGRAAKINTQTSIPSENPLAARMWQGNCSSGQLTRAGLMDALQHGRDFWSVYGPGGPAHFIDEVSVADVQVRASPSPRTAQVAGAFLHGMGYPADEPFPIIVEPEALDGIVPSYDCQYASELRSAIERSDEWKQHLSNKSHVFDAINKVLVTTAADKSWNSWIDHAFDMITSRTCHGHPLPQNAVTGRSIDWETAQEVFRMGDWEYDYIWNRAEQSEEYVRYQTAVLLDELLRDLKAVKDGHPRATPPDSLASLTLSGETHETSYEGSKPKVKLFIGHDGTMVRLLKSLAQAGRIRWPALGSEVVLEVWHRPQPEDALYVRILSYGRLLASVAPLLRGRTGHADWLPLEDVIEYLESRLPSDLAARC